MSSVLDRTANAAAMAVLADSERARAGKFLHDPSRATYVETRAALRRILGRYLGIGAADVRLDADESGKPRLASPCDAPLSFNVAHTDGLALVAITRGERVGVDVERVRDDLDHASLARMYFAREEQAELAGLPAADRRLAFFVCWTRKEAYLKATGRGLSTPLDSFSVSVSPEGPAALRQVEDDPAAAIGWRLSDVAVAPGYVACVAVDGPAPTIRLLDYEQR